MSRQLDPLLHVIAELRIRFPDWRFGQLVSNVTALAGHVEMEGLYDVTDDELAATAQAMVERHFDRRGDYRPSDDESAENAAIPINFEVPEGYLPDFSKRELVYEELHEAIAELRRLFPRRRLAQLTTHLVAMVGYAQVESIYDVHDEELLIAAGRMAEDHRQRFERLPQREPATVGE